MTFASAYDSRSNNFGAFRFLQAAVIIFYHCQVLSGRVPAAEQTVWFQLAIGMLDCFFFLSGFLVTQSWLAAPALRLYVPKRLLRLMPAMVVALVFGAFVVGPLATSGSAGAYLLSSEPWRHFLGILSPPYLVSPTCFVDNPFPKFINGPLWSLRYEFVCYALVPLLGALPERWMRWGTAALLAWFWGIVLSGRTPAWMPAPMPPLMACFMAGMAFWVFRERVPYTAALAVPALGLLAVTLFTHGFREVFPLAGGYVFFYAGFAPRLRLRRWSHLGDFAYGLYVFTYPMQQLLVHYFGAGIPLGVYYVASFGLGLALAVSCWRFIEEPALRLKPGAKGTAGRANVTRAS